MKGEQNKSTELGIWQEQEDLSTEQFRSCLLPLSGGRLDSAEKVRYMI